MQKYLKEKKLILLLDLDNTILHASNLVFSREEYEALKQTYGWQIAALNISGQPCLIKFRPYLKEFFEAIKNFDIFIYTYGTLDYAKEIIRYLNITLKTDCLNCHKLVARENNTYEYKNIKKIFPSTENMVIILDDRKDVWNNSSNLINLSPYFFFNEEKYFKLKGKKYIEDDKDCVLYSISRLLNFIHGVFYRYYELNREKENNRLCVKTIISNKFKQIFYNKNFILSGIFNKDTVDIFQSKHNYIIQLFGGNLYEDFTKDNDIILVKKFIGK